MTEKTFAAQIQALPSDEMGITSSPSTTLEIVVDITEKSKTSRALGQMVHVLLKEDEKGVFAVGQIVGLATRNRWHEDMAFKGVIKRHGSLPHLSDVADNRLATVSVQSCFDLSGEIPAAHILGVSPSTGKSVNKMDNRVMSKLVAHQEDMITRIGRVYGTGVDMPMWFKHFGKGDDGAGDAYHIGVFGKTGSGKTVTAAMMMLGYARNKECMNILVLDPQQQFTLDQELLPDGGGKLLDKIKDAGMTCESLDLVRDVLLPKDSGLFADLLLANGFIHEAFELTTDDKKRAMRDWIASYMTGRMKQGSSLWDQFGSKKILSDMLKKLLKDGVEKIYRAPVERDKLTKRTEIILPEAESSEEEDKFVKMWQKVFTLFSGKGKTPMVDIVEKIVSSEGGNFIVLNLAPGSGELDNENLQAVFLQQIERKIAETGGMMYAKGDKKPNCLVVMDEAHRFVAEKSPDKRVQELTREIVDAVRTTRKYGIGHMFITQTLESMNDEILKQMRVFAFGHGLTTGAELRKVGEVVNSPASVALYKSFIDPGGIKKFPFMFFGPVSPFSATGSPLFVEIYTEFAEFEEANKHRLTNRSKKASGGGSN